MAWKVALAVIGAGSGSAVLWLCGAAGACVRVCGEQEAGERGGLVADLRMAWSRTSVRAVGAQSDDVAFGPASGVALGAVRVGV